MRTIPTPSGPGTDAKGAQYIMMATPEDFPIDTDLGTLLVVQEMTNCITSAPYLNYGYTHASPLRIRAFVDRTPNKNLFRWDFKE